MELPVADRIQKAPPEASPAARFYELHNRSGLRLCLTNFGAALVSLRVPDRDGNADDILLGYDTLDEYRADPFYLGVIVGRCANRIAGGRLPLGGEHWQLARNDGPNHLHGGHTGFGKRLWRAQPYRDGGGQGVRLSYTSPHGEDGYPGELRVEVDYRLRDNNSLRIDYRAQSDRLTAVNLSNHAYFNLAGHAAGSILDHRLRVCAARYTPVDEHQIPCGELAPVENTPLDFRRARSIRASVCSSHPQIARAGGLDHNWVLKRRFDRRLRPAASLFDPRSGRLMTVLTDQPGIQCYSSNSLNARGKNGAIYARHGAICLETQHFPDAVNQPHFPSVLLAPGRLFESTTLLHFSLA